MLTAVSGGGSSGDGSPRVSVVMAVRNGERFVAEAIESLQAQTLDDFELIVVDDGSTDATPEHRPGSRRPGRAHPAALAANTGYPEALNVGWRLARGEYVAILDADDLAEPNRLERQLTYLDEHPEVGVVGGSLLLVTGDGRPFYVAAYPATAAEVLEGLRTHCPVGHTAVLMRRAVLEEVGGYRDRRCVGRGLRPLAARFGAVSDREPARHRRSLPDPRRKRLARQHPSRGGSRS